jgi:hypothetical protein
MVEPAGAGRDPGIDVAASDVATSDAANTTSKLAFANMTLFLPSWLGRYDQDTTSPEKGAVNSRSAPPATGLPATVFPVDWSSQSTAKRAAVSRGAAFALLPGRHGGICGDVCRQGQNQSRCGECSNPIRQERLHFGTPLARAEALGPRTCWHYRLSAGPGAHFKVASKWRSGFFPCPTATRRA